MRVCTRSASRNYKGKSNGLEYLRRSPAIRKRRRKEIPVPGVITGPPCSGEGHKCGDLTLLVGGVLYEAVKYGRVFFGTWTRVWLLWQDPEAIVRVIYISILSSKRTPHIKKPTIVRQRTKNLVIGSSLEPDTKTGWPTGRRSQLIFNFNRRYPEL
jgi:hypothetical protein